MSGSLDCMRSLPCPALLREARSSAWGLHANPAVRGASHRPPCIVRPVLGERSLQICAIACERPLARGRLGGSAAVPSLADPCSCESRRETQACEAVMWGSLGRRGRGCHVGFARAPRASAVIVTAGAAGGTLPGTRHCVLICMFYGGCNLHYSASCQASSWLQSLLMAPKASFLTLLSTLAVTGKQRAACKIQASV